MVASSSSKKTAHRLVCWHQNGGYGEEVGQNRDIVVWNKGGDNLTEILRGLGTRVFTEEGFAKTIGIPCKTFKTYTVH